MQLVAARDIGLAAAVALQQPKSFANRSIEVAGDELTPQQMCAAFAAAQGAPVRHSRPPAWLFWLLGNKDLFNIIRFLEKEGFHADVAACRATFPGMLSFAEFLQASHWADPSRTYEDGIGYDLPALLTSDDDVQARRA